jgi:outer membrane protein insertion porin family
MVVPALLLILAVAASGLPCWGDCPKDAVPPDVVQFEDEVGARPRNVAVRELHLVNIYNATVDEQQQIAASLLGFCFRADERAELSNRIRDAVQRHGFFKAQVIALDMERLDRRADPPEVYVTARIDEGARYRLREIKFTGNKAVIDTAALRRLIPMKDGGIFDIELVRDGLKNLRDAYGNLGYINFTPVPDTQFDDQKKLITLTLDLDEGAQFYVNSVSISGADPQRESALHALWPEALQPGKIYNARLVKLFFTNAKDLLPPGADPHHNLLVKQNAQRHTVDIIVRLNLSFSATR